MIKPKRSAEQQVADEAERRALNPLASRQTISDSQAEPEFRENHKRLKADRLAREAGLKAKKKMSERLETLKKARDRMIEDRDTHAKVLAAPFDRDKAERARIKFVEIQCLIDSLDRAIRGEEGQPARSD